MKKLILGITGVLLSVVLMACGTSTSDATLTSLANQLDETSNTISSMQTANPSVLALSNDTTQSVSSQIYQNAQNTQKNLLNEEYYKTDILQETAKIKNHLNKNLKLSKAQISAIKDLTSSLAKYTNSVSYTQSEMKNAIKSMSSMKKNVDKNADKINAKLNKIACNSNARSSYYENILNTLAELENCLNLETQSNTQNANQNNSTNQSSQNYAKTQNTLPKNIDTYISTGDENTENNTDQASSSPDTTNFHYANNFRHPPYYVGGYGNVYNRYERFNPNRNTDTYGPMTRNIDTYGRNRANYAGYGNYGNGFNNGFYNGYGFYGYGNGFYNNPEKFYNSNNFNRMNYPAYANTEAEKRLEDFEEVKDDNTVEKVEEKQSQLESQTETHIIPQNNTSDNISPAKDTIKDVDTSIGTENNEIKDNRHQKIQKVHHTFNAHTRPTPAQQNMTKMDKNKNTTSDRHKQIEALSISTIQ